MSSDSPPPSPSPKWFYATDIPKYYPNDTKIKSLPSQKQKQPPQVFEEFTKRHSKQLEELYQKLSAWREATGQTTQVLLQQFQQQPQQLPSDIADTLPSPSTISPPARPLLPPFSTTALVNEDNLFEADVNHMLLYPVYWKGPAYEVRRGLWFFQAPSGKWLPCDYSLSKQLEDGYKKIQPWKFEPTQPSVTETSSETSSADSATSKPAQNAELQQKIPLFGPHLGQIALYVDSNTAWLLSDTVPAKIAHAVLSTFTSVKYESLGGQKVIRGYEDIPKATPAKTANKEKERRRSSITSDSAKSDELKDKTPGIAEGGLVEEDEDEDDRPVDHLILVVHGIGQKLSERLEAVFFPNDVANLRRGIRRACESLLSNSATPQAPVGGSSLQPSEEASTLPTASSKSPRIQVLPIQWRQQVHFAVTAESVSTSLSAPVGPRSRAPSDVSATSFFTASNPSPTTPTDIDLGTSIPESVIPPLNVPPMDVNNPTQPIVEKNVPPQMSEEESNKLPALDEILLNGVSNLRTIVTDIVLDILLYMTPRYRQEIITTVTNELNRVYRLFISRNPGYKGTVSIFAHSLGSVICLEILSNQRDLKMPAKLDIEKRDGEYSSLKVLQQYDLLQSSSSSISMSTPIPNSGLASLSASVSRSSKSGLFPPPNDIDALGTGSGKGNEAQKEKEEDAVTDAQGVVFNQLRFEVENYFAVGSPCGLFLLLQNERLRCRLPCELPQDLLSDEGVLNESLGDLSLDDSNADRKAKVGFWSNLGNSNSRNSTKNEGSDRFGEQEQVRGTNSNTKTNSSQKSRDLWRDTPVHEEWTTSPFIKRPKTKYLYNLFHPSDPVAFRMEPLVSRQFANNQPYSIPYTKGGLRGLHQNITVNVSSLSTQIVDKFFATSTSIFKATASLNPFKPTEDSSSSSAPVAITNQEGTSELVEGEEREKTKMEGESFDDGVKNLNSRYQRIDFSLLEGVFEHPYIGILKSHMDYWADDDIAYFVAGEVVKGLNIQ
ncbi:DDHD domain-containing protein [Paraphysoderma sedebokerense]|nr:DDHD domain-containing protein [Paraphysoderma sedebokerense]